MRKRGIQVKVRMNGEEYRKLMDKVKRTGLSREAYIRTVLEGATPKEPPPADYYGMMKELHAIGNSMNQIAARANVIGFIDAAKYSNDLKALQTAILKIQQAVTLPERSP